MNVIRLFALALVFVSACAGIGAGFALDAVDEVLHHATYDFSCPKEKISVDTVIKYERYNAQGCGKMATYLMNSRDNVVTLNEPVKPIEEKK